MTKNTSIAKIDTFRTALEKARDRLAEVAPQYLSVDRLIRIMLSGMSRNPKLMECDSNSVLQFCMRCAETGLEPIGAGGAWPIPFENKKAGVTEMQFIPDYRGLVNCAKHAGCITHAVANVVHEADEFRYTLGLNPTLTHAPATGDRGERIAAYCVYTLPNGDKDFVVMDGDEIEGIRNRSRAAQVGPWKSDTGEMWKKTVIRRAMKPFAGANVRLDAAVSAFDEVDGLADVKTDPVSMPKPIDADVEVSEPKGPRRTATA